MSRVSVIIVNWNGRHLLTDCLDSLAAQRFRDFKVILVDNGSTDGSADWVREAYSWVHLVTLATNSGFAAGNNRGLEHADGEYVVTLNNDTRVESHWLEQLVAIADAHPRAGMVGSRICSFDDPDQIDSLGMGICGDGMSRGWLRNRRWSSLQMQDVEPILLPSACAALYRRDMLQETGFFDDDFFAYAEDTDLGLRGRLAGWEALLATRAVVHHKYSQTSGGLSPLKVRLVERNHFWVAVKTFPAGQLVLLPALTAWRYALQLRAVLGGRGVGGEFRDGGTQGSLTMAVLRGVTEAALGLPRMLRKRREIMRSRRLPMRELKKLLRQHRIRFGSLLDTD